MTRGHPPLFAVLLVSASVSLGLKAHARSSDFLFNASHEMQEVRREIVAIQKSGLYRSKEKKTVEQSLAEGEILFRSKEYTRALEYFNEIIETYPNTQSYVEALWFRGETFYLAKEYLPARRDYLALLQWAALPHYRHYFAKALPRLVDVAMRRNDLDKLDFVLEKIERLLDVQADTALQYAKGKALFLLGRYDAASQALDRVPQESEYAHQSLYFQGVMALQGGGRASSTGSPLTEAKAALPLQKFHAATVLAANTEDQRKVVDLSWLAIGRIFYELEQCDKSVAAYTHVERESDLFATMLFEIAWVYIRMHDTKRAQRALEVLSVANPEVNNLVEGLLLRADILLRDKEFKKALDLYQQVRALYDPMKDRLENFLEKTQNPVSVYYAKILEKDYDLFDQRQDQVPVLAIRLAKDGQDGERAFSIIDDVSLCKQLIQQSQQLIERLMAVVSAHSRVQVFPELRVAQQHVTALLNRLIYARLEIARALDQVEPSQLVGELERVRMQRRSLMPVMARLPRDATDLDVRIWQSLGHWNRVLQTISRLSLELDQQKVMIDGIRLVLKDESQRGIVRDPASLRQISQELDANEREFEANNKILGEMRHTLEISRLQAGFGDASFQHEIRARQQFVLLLTRELEGAGTGKAGSSAIELVKRATPLLTQLRLLEKTLEAFFATMEQIVNERIVDLQRKVNAEAANISLYAYQLTMLDGEVQLLVGSVAKRNFEHVLDQFWDVVRRADVGISEEAWEVREEQRTRVQMLQRERARQDQRLGDELRDLLRGQESP